MHKLILLLFASLIFQSNIFANNDSTMTQCVVITNNRPDVEVFINNKSYGKFLSDKFNLPLGRYEIFGRINNNYDDYERIKITSKYPEVVTLRIKNYQFCLSPRYAFIYVGKYLFKDAFSLNVGFKTFKHHFGINFELTQCEEFFRGGFYYTYILYQNKYMIIEPGLTAGYSYFSYSVQEPADGEFDWYGTVIKDLSFKRFDIGPKVMYQIGLEHVKFCASYELLFSEMLITSIEAGVEINF